MKLLKSGKLSVVALAIGVLVTLVPAAKANLFCNSWNSGGFSGDTVFSCNISTKTSGGSFCDSYVCDTRWLNYGFCNFQINDHTSNTQTYQGDCTIVFKCSDGKTYSCDVKNWNGCDLITCWNIPSDCRRDCQDVEIICKPKCDTTPTCVPEPSTIVAGALLLIPFGVSTARILRKNKNLPTT